MPKGIFRHIAAHLRRRKEYEALGEVWDGLPARRRAIIMIEAGLWDAPNPYASKPQHKRSKKGEPQPWLMPALNKLKESHGQISDREIARQVGVAHSTLIRNETYLRARKSLVKVRKPSKVVTRDSRALGKMFEKEDS